MEKKDKKICPLCFNIMRDDVDDGMVCMVCGVCGTKLYLGRDICKRDIVINLTPRQSTKY